MSKKDRLIAEQEKQIDVLKREIEIMEKLLLRAPRGHVEVTP